MIKTLLRIIDVVGFALFIFVMVIMILQKDTSNGYWKSNGYWLTPMLFLGCLLQIPFEVLTLHESEAANNCINMYKRGSTAVLVVLCIIGLTGFIFFNFIDPVA